MMTVTGVTVTVMVTSEGKSLQEEHIKNGQEPLLLQGECLLPTCEGLRMDRCVCVNTVCVTGVAGALSGAGGGCFVGFRAGGVRGLRVILGGRL